MTAARFLLNPQSLMEQVSSATYERGLALYRSQNVLDYTLKAAGSQEWDIEGDVMGSGRGELYEVSVKVETGSDGKIAYFIGECDCPVGGNCKHCVALTFKAAYKSGGVLSQHSIDGPGTPVLRPPSAGQASAEHLAQIKATQQHVAAERERQAAHGKVSHWLDLFGDAQPSASPDQIETIPQYGAADQIVYVLICSAQSGHPVLQIGYGQSRRQRNGRWGKVKLSNYFDGRGATAQDKEVVRLIDALSAQGYSYSYGQASTAGAITGEAGLLALRLAAATGRLFLTSEPRVLGRQMALGPTRTLTWKWNEITTVSSSESLWALRPQLASSRESPAALDGPTTADAAPTTGALDALDASVAPLCFVNDPPLYLDAQAGLCGHLEYPGVAAAHLTLLMKAPPIPQSAFASQEALLLRRLAALPLPPVVKAPRMVQGVQPVARLRIDPVAPADMARLGLLRATLRFDYQGLLHYTVQRHNPVLLEQIEADAVQGASRVLLHRDLAQEQAALDALHGLGLVGNADGAFHLPFLSDVQQQQWLHWADADFEALRQAGFALELAPGLEGWITRADALDVRMQAPAAPGADAQQDDLVGGDDSRSPWFDLSLGMDIDGQRHNILPLLPALLQNLGVAQLGVGGTSAGATLQMPAFVFLAKPDGSYLRLPTEPLRPWLQALLDLVGERGGQFSGSSLRLSRLEALRVGASLGEGARWQGADALRQMVRQLAGRSALPEVAVPEGLRATLRPYQQQGLEWLQFLRANGLAGILADDMGLGKTLQTLAHVLVEKNAGRLDRPALVIAPVSVLGNWRREAERFAPDLRTLVLHGKERHEAAAEMAKHDLVIAPYSLLQRDRERWMKQGWHLVALDEAQNIKNANTHAAQVVGELDARHRLCLSGTPMENHLGELWSLFHFLMPGFLGSQARFKELFRTPIEKHGDSERLDQLRRRVTPFMLRRAKREVATDLPEKQEAISGVELEGKQADLYETIRLSTEKAVREALADKGLAKSQIQILDALLKLRQVCCDPRLVPIASAKKIKQSAKLELLMEMLPEMLAEGRKVLLFSQFTSMLALIEEELGARGIEWVKLTGQSQKREAIIERFTSGAVPLFLISLKAGGTGLNLAQADTVIHYDPWWNPAVETQATDRAHRIGQTQRVFVYKLVALGTIEERILALQERKAALADSMYSGAQARKQPLFTEGDLADLLKPLGA